MKKNYDLKVNIKEYNVGDLANVLDTVQVKGRCKTLSTTWTGPGLIVGKLSSFLYKIKLRGNITIVNHDRLKLCCDKCTSVD